MDHIAWDWLQGSYEACQDQAVGPHQILAMLAGQVRTSGICLVPENVYVSRFRRANHGWNCRSLFVLRCSSQDVRPFVLMEVSAGSQIHLILFLTRDLVPSLDSNGLITDPTTLSASQIGVGRI